MEGEGFTDHSKIALDVGVDLADQALRPGLTNRVDVFHCFAPFVNDFFPVSKPTVSASQF